MSVTGAVAAFRYMTAKKAMITTVISVPAIVKTFKGSTPPQKLF
jgi:hypothetical protein